MKDNHAHVRFTIIWDRITKEVRAGVHMCYYPAASPLHVMAMIPGTRVVRVLCVVMAAPCSVVACVCVGVVAQCARLRPTAPGSASTKRFLFFIMHKRRDCTKSASEPNIDLNMR
jgi:hypothetical protein